jgi:hypothetical protein
MQKGEIYKVTDLFTKEEVDYLIDKVEKNIVTSSELNDEYGRICIFDINVPDELIEKLNKIVSEMFGVELMGQLSLAVEYNLKYGAPNLPPHFDGDDIEIILNYQLSSNTSWAVGVNTEVFDMEDNSALIFAPNANAHWRPHKKFEEEEFVRMIFFRFVFPDRRLDYSHMRYVIPDPIFDDAHKFRNSISTYPGGYVMPHGFRPEGRE